MTTNMDDLTGLNIWNILAAGPACTSDDPTNHQGDTCPVHESEPHHAPAPRTIEELTDLGVEMGYRRALRRIFDPNLRVT